MNEGSSVGFIILILHALIVVLAIVRVLLRAHREPASRIAWILVIISLPAVGILAYILLGETNIGRRRVARMKKIIKQLPDLSQTIPADTNNDHVTVPKKYIQLFQAGKTVNGFDPVGGNSAQLMQDSNSTITSMVADIDEAKKHVHIMFYIWLTDNNGCRMVDVLIRAAQRGVACRVMVDSLGSRSLIDSPFWQKMKQAGVSLAVALPVGNPLLRSLVGRIDLRNHRKIIVVDNCITYCGSQNCADPEFLVKAKYAPWVDVMMRFEGPIARQNQYLFASDWAFETGEDISSLLEQDMPSIQAGFLAQVIGTGPTVHYSAMPEIFEMLMYTARHEIIITTPYYVPDESMQAALCACARRGVSTTLVLPARNDSRVVAAASKSYYGDLLAAGVCLFEYEGGLLHTKSLTLDGEITLIGSANMDRRSFELNYENNILFYDPSLTAEMQQRQNCYIDSSNLITKEMVAGLSRRQRLWNNAIAMFGPVL